MQPSSLIFLAIVGLWAAYLVPQWVRRRDAMLQTRGQDGHSDGLRVLGRRYRGAAVTGPSTTPLLIAGDGTDDAVPHAVATAGPRAVAAGTVAAGTVAAPGGAVRLPEEGGDAERVEPGRGQREQAGRTEPVGQPESAGESVVVGQSEPRPGPSAATTPVQTRPTRRPMLPTWCRPVADGPAGPPAAPASGAGPAVQPDAGPGPSASAVPAGRAPADRAPADRVTTGQARSGSPSTSGTAARMAARRRTRVLGVLLTLTATGWAAAATALVPVAAAGAPTVLLLADLVALRASARRRAAVRGAAASAPAARPGQGVAAPGEGRSPSAARSRRPVRKPGAGRTALPPTALRSPRATGEPSAGEILAHDGTWVPVPVPPPTYTLKPVAHRAEPTALELGPSQCLAPGESLPPGADRAVVTAGAADDPALPSQAGSAAVDVDEAVAGAATDPVTDPATDPVTDPATVAEGEPDDTAPGAAAGSARRPWDDEREWADDLDLDAVLARRRAVNG